MRLVDLECAVGSMAWESSPPQPGERLLDTTSGVLMEVFSAERNEFTGGWALVVVVEDESAG